MRILMLTQNIAVRGGTYARCFSLARNLVALQHQVTVLAAGRQRRWRPESRMSYGVRVIELPGLLPARMRHGGLDPLDLFSRLQHVRQERYDILHTFDHRPTVSLPALWHRHRHHAPIVGDWCDLWGQSGLGAQRHGLEKLLLTPFDQFSETRFMAHVDAVTPISTELQRRSLALGHPDYVVPLLPAGASDDLIKPEPVEEARRKLGLPLNVPVLVFSGYTAFGMRLMGEAFVEVSRRWPGVRLLLVGGPLRELELVIAQAGLQNSLHHFGEVPYEQVFSILACGDVMLLPYPDQGVDQAGFPNKLGDYMAAGRPLVTNPVGDSHRFVQAEDIGLVAQETPLAFAEAICTLLADAPRRQAMGQRARQLAEGSFSWRARAHTVNELYQCLLGR